MFREAMKQQQGARNDIVDNINEVAAPKGTSRSYTLDRLKRESPDLLKAVCEGENLVTILPFP